MDLTSKVEMQENKIKELTRKVGLQGKEIKELTSKVELQENEIKEMKEFLQESTRLASDIAALNERLTETEREVGRVGRDGENFIADIRAAAVPVICCVLITILSLFLNLL